MPQETSLILFCGKMGAGKSTAAVDIAQQRNAVLISEDHWLSTLYPEQINTFEDYITFSAQLRPLIQSHVRNILQTGTSVVMDFPANTRRQRQWFYQLSQLAGVTAQLNYLKISDELCLQRIAQRRSEQPSRAAFDTEDMFHHVSQFFEEPDATELLNFEVVTRAE